MSDKPFDLQGKVKFNKNYYIRQGRKQQQQHTNDLVDKLQAELWAIDSNLPTAVVFLKYDALLGKYLPLIKGENK